MVPHEASPVRRFSSPSQLPSSLACGGDSLEDEGNGEDTGDQPLPRAAVTHRRPELPRGAIITSMYQLLLENAGYEVTTKTVTTRDVYMGEERSRSTSHRSI